MTDTSQVHRGGCPCGAVRYLLRGAPLYSAYRHCRSCRKAIGADFANWVGAETENFELFHGRFALFACSPGVSRGFCGPCGGSPTHAGEGWPGRIAILAATLDEPGMVTPTAHNHLEHKLPRVRLGDDPTRRQRFSGDRGFP